MSNSSLPSSRISTFSPNNISDIITSVPVVFFTGKGGVGKTTSANLVAQSLASLGERVLFISLYDDESTKQALGLDSHPRFSEKNVLIRDGKDLFDIYFLSPSTALKNYLDQKKLGAITKRLTKAGLLDAVALIVPGMRELLLIGDIRSKAESGNWDRIIVDAPSTGHARSLFDIGNSASQAAKSGVINSQALRAREFLKDPSKCQVVVVTLPKKMALSECREFIFELEENTNIAITGLIINQCDLLSKMHRDRIDEELKSLFIPTLAISKIRKTITANTGDQKIDVSEKFNNIINTQIRLDPLSKTCIVLGTGGVGKTTISSAIAISRARVEHRASSILESKQKVALLTVDPARRLGTALGLDDTASRQSFLDADTLKVTSKDKATLCVFQLDAKQEFFDLLEKTLSRENFEKCKVNSFVHAIATMGIINEFMAIEAMYHLVDQNNFDLVVVDTPPSHTIFDLLDAPAILQKVFRSHIFIALSGNNAVTNFSTNVAMRTILRPLKSLVGLELIEDTIFFLKQVREVEKVFSSHCEVVNKLLKLQSTSYVGVCNPTTVSREQILVVDEQMTERGSRINNIVINGFSTDLDVEHNDINDFAKRINDLNSKISVIEECDLDDPLKVVTSIANEVKWYS